MLVMKSLAVVTSEGVFWARSCPGYIKTFDPLPRNLISNGELAGDSRAVPATL